MPRYRKKPVEIEATQFPSPLYVGGRLAFDDWVVEHGLTEKLRYRGSNLIIKTLEGEMEAEPGDWIIIGVEGEVYSCKPSIFKKTYERVT